MEAQVSEEVRSVRAFDEILTDETKGAYRQVCTAFLGAAGRR